MRTPVIAGNWKMFKAPGQAEQFFEAFLARHSPREDRTLVFFPPAIALTTAIDACRERADVAFGVQNVHWEKEGAFTGENSVPMAAGAGAKYVLIGHSERRHVFGETDAQVTRKTAAVLAAGLVPVICVGEKLEERRGGQLEDVLSRQMAAALEAVAPGNAFIIAYEPVWAIGTGVNATPADAAAAHAFIRQLMAARLGDDVARNVPILYGGSVKPDNAAELLAAGDVDGLLVGGASLDPEGFARIANA